MAKSRKKTCLAVLRSMLGEYGSEGHFAKMISKSPSWVRKASAGIIPISEDAAMRISYETGVSFGWLLQNDVTAPAFSFSETDSRASNRPPENNAYFPSAILSEEPAPYSARPLNEIPSARINEQDNLDTAKSPYTLEAFAMRRVELKSDLPLESVKSILQAEIDRVLDVGTQALISKNLPRFTAGLRNFLNHWENQYGSSQATNPATPLGVSEGKSYEYVIKKSRESYRRSPISGDETNR